MPVPLTGVNFCNAVHDSCLANAVFPLRPWSAGPVLRPYPHPSRSSHQQGELQC